MMLYIVLLIVAGLIFMMLRPKNKYNPPKDIEKILESSYDPTKEYDSVEKQPLSSIYDETERHPVLAYQYSKRKGIAPANWGDPIRIKDISGPLPDSYQGIPVPAGALKKTNDLGKYGSFTSFGDKFPYQNRPIESQDFTRDIPGNLVRPQIYVGNVDSSVPLQEVRTPWEKIGILTKEKEILNLFQRPIAPMQDLWEYQVQDKNGFVIKLEEKKYIENGDVIPFVIGKNGPWKAHVFTENKYVLV